MTFYAPKPMIAPPKSSSPQRDRVWSCDISLACTAYSESHLLIKASQVHRAGTTKYKISHWCRVSFLRPRVRIPPSKLSNPLRTGFGSYRLSLVCTGHSELHLSISPTRRTKSIEMLLFFLFHFRSISTVT